MPHSIILVFFFLWIAESLINIPSGTDFQSKSRMIRMQYLVKPYDWRAKRNWKPVEDYYEALMSRSLSPSLTTMPRIIRGNEPYSITSIQELAAMGTSEHGGGEFESKNERYSGARCRKTYAVLLGYKGTSYSGYQRQKEDLEKKSVEDDLRRCLKNIGGAGSLTVAGRTDKNVSAISQIVSFSSSTAESEDSILNQLRDSDAVQSNKMAIYDCKRVPRSFNARSSATWRRYVYLLPLRPQHDVNLIRLRAIMTKLEGQELPYNAYAFGDQYNVGMGLMDKCTLLKVKCGYIDLSCAEVDTDCSDNTVNMHQPVLIIELVGNRFLRRMVRILVATAVRESTVLADGAELEVDGDDGFFSSSQSTAKDDDNVLVDIALSGDRSRVGYALPGVGLCFAGVGYDHRDLAFYKFQPKETSERLKRKFASESLE